MQEATTNAIKRSGATRLTISFALEQDAGRCLRIDIEDNGQGMGALSTAGHGLGDMKSRAGELAGWLVIRDAPSGGRVSLTVPTRSTGSPWALGDGRSPAGPPSVRASG